MCAPPLAPSQRAVFAVRRTCSKSAARTTRGSPPACRKARTHGSLRNTVRGAYLFPVVISDDGRAHIIRPGLLGGQGWARWFAIVVVSLNFIAQLGFLGNSQYPLWSLTVIALNVIVLYALTARWSESKAELAASRL
jgi:hypothetical protein